MVPLLFTPLVLGPVTMQNRVAVSPMCQYSANDGCASDWHMQHLSHLGNSGAGLIMVEATAVRRDGRITHGCLGLYSEENEQALRKVIEQAKKFSGNSLFGIQLAHAGRKASTPRPWEGEKPLTSENGAWQTIAPSSIAFAKDWHIPKALSRTDIPELIQSFVEAAKRAVRIGFSVIELHAAHGYLLHQFFSPISNQRNDEYGGTLENRMRLLLEIVDAVKGSIPSDVALGMRITGSDWDDRGIQIEDSIALAQRLKQKGVHYACVSSGGLISGVSIPVGPLYQVKFAEAVKKGSGITTRAVGMIRRPHEAEQIIKEGKTDCVALARAFLDDPHWVWHAADSLGVNIQCPVQYRYARPPYWKSPSFGSEL